MLHLSEYSILAAGPEVSRKSKLAFRLSSPEPIPHQQQHHVFFTESAQSLRNWLHSLQVHINHAAANWSSSSKAGPLTAAGLGLQQQRMVDQRNEGKVVPGQSIIDRVLDRLHLDDPSAPTAIAATSTTATTAGGLTDSTTKSMTDTARIPYIPPNFPQSHEDNNDTWSSTSSMPNTSTNTSANLEYIFALNQQNQATKSSMDSIRDRDRDRDQRSHPQGSPLVGGGNNQTNNPTSLSYANSSTGYAESTFTDQTSTSEANRLSLQSVEYQGRSSLHQPRASPSAGSGFHAGTSPSISGFMHNQLPQQSPRMYPIRSSIHSGLSAENASGSPSTSVAGSPYASPTLSSQHPTFLSSSHHSSHHHPGTTGSASPRTFYRVLENSSPSKRAESIASSASISTIASSGDVSTINDLNSENGLSSTATDSSLPPKHKSAGATILGLVTGSGKHKKEKKEGSSAGSNHSGSGSGNSGLKLFGSGVCHFSGCTQMAKTCTFHNKKFRPESPSVIANKKAKEEKKAAKEVVKKAEDRKTPKSSLWSSSSDKSGSQGNISEISSPIMMKADGSLLSNYGSGSTMTVGRGFSSRSMVSLPRDAEFGIDPSMVPLPPSQLRSLASSPIRRRSPSVSVLEDSHLQGNEQQGQQQQESSMQLQEINATSAGGHSMRPRTPLSAAPSQPLPPPPPRAASAASFHRPGTSNKETFSLSRKMGLQMGSEFGAGEKSAMTGTALDGNYFVANHHRTMQKFQQSRKPQQQQRQFIDQQQQQQQLQFQKQQQQSELFKGAGVSRHIVAPDELAMAIEMEAEELRRRQAEAQEVQKARPTSMVKGGAYHSLPIQLHLATVSESTALTDDGDESELLGSIQESRSSPPQDGDRIISSQEQLACAPPETPSMIESDRSPISGFTAGIAPLSPNPGSQLPPSAVGLSLSDFISTPAAGGGSSAKSSSFGSPRSNSLSAGSSVSSPGFPPGPAGSQHSQSRLDHPHSPMSLSSSSSLFYNRQISSSSGPGLRHPMSPMSTSFMEEDRSEFPMRSLPPPKRHGNDHLLFKGAVDSNGASHRGGLPRRSSAAAAVTLSSPSESANVAGTAPYDQQVGPAASSPASGTSLRPAYMARRQSSSPVLIRVSDQGGQNISPLLTGGATRTFAGNTPSREVFRHPSELTTPMSSSEGSPAASTSTGSSSMYSLVTSRYTGQQDGASAPMSPNQDATSGLPSPTLVRGRPFSTASSPLASATPVDGCIPSTSPNMASVAQMPSTCDVLGHGLTPLASSAPATAASPSSSQPYRFPALMGDDVPEVVVNSPYGNSASSSPKVQTPNKRVLHNVGSFQFPAPSGSTDDVAVDGNGRPLSSCSSVSEYSSASENFATHEEGGEDHRGDSHRSMEERYKSPHQQYQQQRRGSNGIYYDGTHSPGGGVSPSLHAAALGLYPGLRKLSLFTAAVGDHPPPPLLSVRKGSAGSSVSTRDYHHGVTSPTLSTMEDGDEVTTEDEELDLHNDDEDWAGNMKSMRSQRQYQEPAIVVVTATVPTTTTGDAVPVTVTVVESGVPVDIGGLSAPPSMPLPLTPPPSTAPPLARSPLSSYSAVKSPPAVPGSYHLPASPSLPLPMTPPVSGGLGPAPAPAPGAGKASPKNPLALAVATTGSPPVIPPRSPHRSVPGSPTTLRSMRPYQSLMSPPPPPPPAF
ncbi:hypothetical protein BGX29_000147 [Mortierella sp. GBA35]|nr:hypothetical protein BGX29_000147 [Mortierella sp. GBA35]